MSRRAWARQAGALARTWGAALLTLCLAASALAQRDEPGTEDHSLLRRPGGAVIHHQFVREPDRLRFPTAHSPGQGPQWAEVEGRHTSIHYVGPRGRGTAEVLRHFKTQLTSQGALTVFECAGRACDHGRAQPDMQFFAKVFGREGGRGAAGDHYLSFTLGSEQQQYWLGKLQQGGQTWVVAVAVTDSRAFGVESLVEVVQASQDTLVALGQPPAMAPPPRKVHIMLPAVAMAVSPVTELNKLSAVTVVGPDRVQVWANISEHVNTYLTTRVPVQTGDQLDELRCTHRVHPRGAPLQYTARLYTQKQEWRLAQMIKSGEIRVNASPKMGAPLEDVTQKLDPVTVEDHEYTFLQIQVPNHGNGGLIFGCRVTILTRRP